jgi:X box-binding protein 1
MTSTRVVFTSIPDNLKRAMTVMESTTAPSTTPRKRQRLTHLSPEEKMLRRKLKNRVAAQTARDRKKAHMDTIEEALEFTQMANQDLQTENQALRDENDCLMRENQELRRRLGLTTDSQVEETKTDASVAVIKKEVGSPESAALNAPLQQVQVQLISAWLATLLCLSLTCFWDFLRTSTPKPQVPQAAFHQTPSKLTQSKTFPTQWWGPQQRSWNPSKN